MNIMCKVGDYILKVNNIDKPTPRQIPRNAVHRKLMIALLMIKKMKNNESEVKNEVKSEVKRNYVLAPKMALKVIPRRTRALMR